MPNISCTSEKTRSDAADAHCSEKTMRTACAHIGMMGQLVRHQAGKDGVCKGTDVRCHSFLSLMYLSRAESQRDNARCVARLALTHLSMTFYCTLYSGILGFQ